MPSSEDHATLAAYIQGVDHAARHHEARWGVGRLPMLVDPELRAKFNRQAVKWRQALESAYETDRCTTQHMTQAASSSAAMERAWGALAHAARDAGYKPLAGAKTDDFEGPEIWETKLKDGCLVAITRTAADASAVMIDGPYAVVYTLDEIGHLIDAIPELMGLGQMPVHHVARAPAFSGYIDRSWSREGDEIPFGD